jgi:dCMP deaminase
MTNNESRRPSWHEHFFAIAKAVAQRSTCPSRKVGAVVVDPKAKTFVCSGYNGAPRGTKHCGDSCRSRETGKSYEKCNAVHAELNAIVNAAMIGVSTNEKHMYLTTTPCLFCARVLINAGISRVYALTYYPHPQALKLLMEGGVDVVVLDSNTLPSFEDSDESEND